jgi:hypothetical protein
MLLLSSGSMVALLVPPGRYEAAEAATTDLIPGYDDRPDNGSTPPLPPNWTKRPPPWRRGLGRGRRF